MNQNQDIVQQDVTEMASPDEGIVAVAEEILTTHIAAFEELSK